MLPRVAAALRLAMGLLVLGMIAYQVTDLAVHDALAPEEYFAYFTIQSCLMIGATLVLSGVSGLRRSADAVWISSASAAMVPFSIITGLVYNALLRGGPAEGYVGWQVPNEIMHVVLPVFILLDWAVGAGRQRVPWRTMWLVGGYPIAWLAFTLVRGAMTGWVPYPFLEPDGPDGPLGVVVYIVVLTSAILLLGAAAILRTRRRVLHQVGRSA